MDDEQWRNFSLNRRSIAAEMAANIRHVHGQGFHHSNTSLIPHLPTDLVLVKQLQPPTILCPLPPSKDVVADTQMTHFNFKLTSADWDLLFCGGDPRASGYHDIVIQVLELGTPNGPLQEFNSMATLYLNKTNKPHSLFMNTCAQGCYSTISEFLPPRSLLPDKDYVHLKLICYPRVGHDVPTFVTRLHLVKRGPATLPETTTTWSHMPSPESVLSLPKEADPIDVLKYKIIDRPRISKLVTTAKIKKMIMDDYEITGGVPYIKVPVTCQLTTKRIVHPAKYSTCSHPQCFELDAFLRMVQTSSKFSFDKCPICDASVQFKDLLVDDLFTRILHAPDRNNVKDPEASFVRVYEDGEWEWDKYKEKKNRQKVTEIVLLDDDEDFESIDDLENADADTPLSNEPDPDIITIEDDDDPTEFTVPPKSQPKAAKASTNRTTKNATAFSLDAFFAARMKALINITSAHPNNPKPKPLNLYLAPKPMPVRKPVITPTESTRLPQDLPSYSNSNRATASKKQQGKGKTPNQKQKKGFKNKASKKQRNPSNHKLPTYQQAKLTRVQKIVQAERARHQRNSRSLKSVSNYMPNNQRQNNNYNGGNNNYRNRNQEIAPPGWNTNNAAGHYWTGGNGNGAGSQLSSRPSQPFAPSLSHMHGAIPYLSNNFYNNMPPPNGYGNLNNFGSKAQSSTYYNAPPPNEYGNFETRAQNNFNTQNTQREGSNQFGSTNWSNPNVSNIGTPIPVVITTAIQNARAQTEFDYRGQHSNSKAL